MSATLRENLSDYPIILSVLSAKYYTESVASLLKDLEDVKICYVTLNKPMDALLRAFSHEGINTKNMFFIDAVTKKEAPNAIMVSSPCALTELSIAISQVMKSNAFDLLFFDSLSTLNVYAANNTKERFTSSIISKLRSANGKGVFTCIDQDSNSEFIAQSSLFMDKVMRFDDVAKGLSQQTTSHAAIAALGVIGILAGSMFLGSTAPTGFAIGGSGQPVSPFASLALVSVFVVALAFAYKTIRPGQFLVKARQIKEERVSPKAKMRLQREFKGKIRSWLSNLKQMVVF